MKRDPLQEAKEHYADAREDMREQYDRIREDFAFSNPSMPDQWDQWAAKARAGRPMHTLDRTNQYVQHVVNTIRAQKTSAQIMAVSGGADVEVAKRIAGIIKHIEYASRADIAWATAADHQVRGGLGWIRVTPKIMDAVNNEQDILIQRIIDPTSCFLEAGWTEPDGSDAGKAWIETSMNKKAFQRLYPKAALTNWVSDGWFSDESVRVCEYFYAEEKTISKFPVAMPDGQELAMTEAEYWALAKQIGFQPQADIGRKFDVMTRRIKWCKMTGAEIIEESEYPSKWIGLVPVLGHELWVEGKRYLCGMVRRLMDGQRLHNYEMSALTESLMAQPKAPFLLSARAVDGREDEWARLNSGNPAYLTYNDLDDQGQPVNAPVRLAPPAFPASYASSANLAVQEMESAVGLPKPALGVASNAVSGRAKMADKEAGSTATYHFADNLRVAEEHVYRIILDMMPKVYSGRRQAKILGEDDAQSSIALDDELPGAVRRENNKVVAINLDVGTYDVRIKVGPSYTTIREEMGVKLQELGKGNPVLASALLPILMKMSDMPEAEKIGRVAIAMLPPEVQKAYHDDDAADLPPAAAAKIQAKDQELQQVNQALDQAGKIIEELHGKAQDKGQEVKQMALAAKADIEAAKADLKAKSDALTAQKRDLDNAMKIAALELELAQMKAGQDIENQRKAAADESDAAATEAKDSASNAIREFEQAHQGALEAVAESTAAELAEVNQNLQKLIDFVQKPVSVAILRDKSGKAIGVEKNGVRLDIRADENGRPSGLEPATAGRN